MSNSPGPSAPADLDTTAKAVWRKVKAIIEKRGDWTDATADAYGLIVSSLARYEMRGRKAREGMTKSGVLNLTTHGSQGQLVPHPNVKTAMDAEKAMLECLRALRLTPQEVAKGGDAGPKAPDGPGKFGL